MQAGLCRFNTGIIPEHHAVREAAGLFDVSHMGEVEIRSGFAFFPGLYSYQSGQQAENGQIQYAIIANQDGGTWMMFGYRQNTITGYSQCANRVKDINWMKQQTDRFDVQVRDISDQIAVGMGT